MGEWVETKAPTCTENGLKYRECAHCSYNETQTLDALGHDFATEWTVDLEATCARVGSESRHCARCDATTDAREIAMTEHRLDGGKETVPPRPDREGIKTTTCLDCGYSYTESIEKTKPEMVEQTVQVWESWSKKDELVFRSNASFEDFVELRINGQVVPADCYRVVEGSIKIIMDPDYVASLKNGDYTVDIVSKNGVASSTFKVSKKAATNPWVAGAGLTGLTALAVVIGIVIVKIRKRRGLQ
jgi:Zn ribbon nucleic-acid-binding protein